MKPKNLTGQLSVNSRQLVASILLLLLQIVITSCIADAAGQSAPRDDYHENLYLRPLADGKLFAHFQFSTIYRKDLKSLRWENKIEIFPLSIADLVATTDLHELHFSLTKGNWNYKTWGYPIRSSPPGAQIRAKFSKHNEDPGRSWQKLVNSLAGKFCASLASADQRALVETKFSLDHQVPSFRSSLGNLTEAMSGTSDGHQEPTDNRRNHEAHARYSGERVLYSNLPDETMCTENLTPWKKLLPCYSGSGLASLLNAVNLLKSSHSSLSMDLGPRQCHDTDGDPIEGCEQVQLTQSLSVVFNPLLQFEGKQSWSLAKMFGNSIQKLCPLASHSQVHVDISDLDDKNKLYPQTFKEYSLHLGLNDAARRYATFDLQALFNTSVPQNDQVKPNDKQTGAQQAPPVAKSFNVGIRQNKIFKRPAYTSRQIIPVHLRTHIAGLGTSDGTIVATVTNLLSEPLRVTYMDVVPHFMRIYLHTLTVRTSSGQELKPDKLNFVLSQGDTPTLIEFSLVLPADSETQISYDFERAFMRWTEFKPGANKGVLLGSAMIGVPVQATLGHLVMPLCTTSHGRLSAKGTIITSSGSNDNSTVLQLVELDDEMTHIYSRPLLVILPTPDFSMPYNVLCFVCTVLVTAIGQIHKLTTRRTVIEVSRGFLEAQRAKKTRQEERAHTTATE